MSEPHHDTALCPDPKCGCPLSTIDMQGGASFALPDARCVGCGEWAKLSPVEWHRTKRADDEYERLESTPYGSLRERIKPRHAPRRQIALFTMPPREAVPHMPTMRKLASMRVPLGAATAAATCVTLGAKCRTDGPTCVELRPLTAATRRIAEGAGFTITTILGRPAAVWVGT